MSKFFIDLENLLNKILDISKKIANLLSKEIKNNDDTINKINELYGERKEILETIDKTIKSNNLTEEDIKKNEKLSKLINEIVEIEQTNLKTIKEKTDNIGNQIKKLAQQKSLLIYEKGKNYEWD